MTVSILQDCIEIPSLGKSFGTGWLPPMPDLRDYTADHPDLAEINTKLGVNFAASLPSQVDLRQWCSPVEDQGQLGSCTAHAAVGVVEYYQCRTKGKFTDGSRLFVYKVTRNLMGVTGDTGAWLRNAMGALALCGVPPEKYWPYTDALVPPPGEERFFDSEPPAFVYAVANNFASLKYFCHDPLGQNHPLDEVLHSVKTYLAKGIPSIFGFFGFSSFNNVDIPGGIPYPAQDEQAVWGHAVAAVGYDDTLKITNTKTSQVSTGALLIRNSWTSTWGMAGYGWLPYDYVLNRLAIDFWSMISMDFIDIGEFDF